MSESVHGSAVLVGAHGVLVRGASGSGKSALAHALIVRGGRLIADDRVCLSACHGRLVASVPASIAGLIELRGRGLLAVAHERAGVIRLVVDIVSAEELERMPEANHLSVAICDITIPRQPVPHATEQAVRLVDAALAPLVRRNMGLRSARV